ncbi:MAG: GntR family transcriptional regulator [Herbinix sp.]|nr:GntR family transcriptional regulator [Herbinix sp.]
MDLSYININKYSAVPLFDQIRASVLEAIKSGILKPGDKVPTEDDICKAFKVSRPVVRQAYSELTKDGYVGRERGRGTFVKEIDNRGIFMHSITSFKEEMSMLGKTPRTEVLHSEIIEYDSKIFSKLNIPAGTRCYHAVRMRYADDKPFEYTDNYLSLDKYPGLNEFDLGKNSLYDILKKKYDVHFSKAKRSIRATKAVSKIAEYLNIPKNTAILVIESIVYDQYDRPVEFCIESISGESHRYDFDVYGE